MLVESESLLNDGVAAVGFAVLVGDGGGRIGEPSGASCRHSCGRFSAES